MEENELLGEFVFIGFWCVSCGEVEIEVMFYISADGIVFVKVRDLEMGFE